MATTKKKTHWYILVITSSGPKFVTKVNNGDRTAEWNAEESPMEMAKSVAEDISLGLNLNMHLAYTVSSPYEITNQPYRYNMGELTWKSKEDKDNE